MLGVPPMNRKDVALDLDAVQQKLEETEGRTYWQSLEELADTAEFQEMLHREFPENATEWAGDAVSRRRFLVLMGASLALAGLGCTKGPQEKIVPYVIQPEGLVPGKPQFYASAVSLAGTVTGVLVESHMGRPTKIEGNPEHPGSLGATDVFAQADILSMYDPDRERTVTYLGKTRQWDEALSAIEIALQGAGGAGVRILTETITSPTLAEQLKRLLTPGEKDRKLFRGAKVVVHEPTAVTPEAAALKAAFKDDVEVIYNIKDADIIVTLDADFLTGGGVNLRYANEFGERRRLKPDETAAGLQERMNRLYAVETMISPTGAISDHRLALKPSEIDAFARALADKVGVKEVKEKGADNPTGKKYAKWIDAIAEDLLAKKGKCVVIPGEHQPAAVHHVAHAINEVLGNLGKTVTFVEPIHKLDLKPEQTQTIADLIEDMKGGKVQVLIILGGNPSYSIPGAMGFNEVMDKVKLRIHHGLFNDETSARCHWHLPATHALENWSDARTFDGTTTIIQPLIKPLYEGRSTHELLAAFTDNLALSGYDIVRAYWQRWFASNKGNLADARAKDDFELFWKQSLFHGIVGYVPPKEDGSRVPAATAAKLKTPAFQKDVLTKLPALPAASSGTYEVNFRPDPALFDGRFANNGWLQEFPKPLTKIAWDNVAHMSLATAKELGVTVSFGRRGGEHGEAFVEAVTLKVDGREIKVPAWIVPGHADGSITLTLGYGRTRAGHVAMAEDRQDTAPIGVDVNPLRKTHEDWMLAGVAVAADKAGGKRLVICTQGHHNLEGRDILHTATIEKRRHGDHDHIDFKIEGSGVHGKHNGNGHKEDKDDHDHEGEKKPAKEEPLPRGEGDLYGQRVPLGLLPPEPQKPGYHRWGMVINLGACTGCSACVIACQAENNIPVVGRDQVMRGREMHWIRIDRYYYTDQKQEKEAQQEPDKAREIGVMHQPVPCQQCEKAPCEQVCPVAATTHSDDGLNDMVYNRCVGTRYCSNNCPYKVRRFNFLEYQGYANDSLKLLRNPDVTVRTRGVMEKCTYCIQRIRQAEIEARKDGREKIRDGEILTACQAVCPTGAIVFGDLGPAENKPESAVGKLRQSELNYGLLDEDLQTHPRTTYLAAVKNPNPKLVEKKG
jgi:molybdopterin-containing oxidoreductase family iron-sulfur binding subunit